LQFESVEHAVGQEVDVPLQTYGVQEALAVPDGLVEQMPSLPDTLHESQPSLQLVLQQ
jgi:hypothetical protein